MARIKQSVVQRDFSLMELREDFIEADTDEMRARSLRGALNMRAMSTRTAQARPGTYFIADRPGAVALHEIRPGDGLEFGIVIRANGFDVIDSAGSVVRSFARSGWGDGSQVWVEGANNQTLLGHPTAGISVLTYDDGAWSLGSWSFVAAEGNESAQPYWAFRKDVLIRPSARTGAITVTASTGVFTPAHVGSRIRYGNREIRITEFISGIMVKGQVVGYLPPSFELTVDNATELRVGEVVIGEDTNWRGIIVSKATGTLFVMTLEFFDGPDVNEKITGPTGGTKITAKTQIAPLASTIWDEALMSPARGYPRSCSLISGRLVFVDFPQVPDLIAISSARDIQDFKVGAADDDAIVRQEGDGAPRWLHAINAGDLLLLSDRGCYYVPIRDNGILTPNSFNAVFFDQRGASPIKPVNVDDGVVFVEANGQTISAALLDGNIYLKWSIRALTIMSHQLIKEPVNLCGPAVSSKEAEKYLLVVNRDGSLAAMSWSMKLGDETVGFAPWKTDGKFVHVSPLFGGYWALVDRLQTRMMERFDYATYLDASVDHTTSSFRTDLTANGAALTANGSTLQVTRPAAGHLAGRAVAVMQGPHFVGMTDASASGVIDDMGVPTDLIQIGLPFVSRMKVWPVELVDSPRIGMVTVRVFGLSVSVLDTTAFQIICNGDARTVGGYSAGDLFSKPPALHTHVFRAPILGRRDHPDLEVVKHIPGPFKVLSIGQEVQG